MAPDIILDVDHLHPVAEGGDDDILNLITSCRDCNRGKGKTPLSQNDSLKKSQRQLLDLADKTEQSQMMIEWKKSMLEIQQQEIESINDLIASITGWELSEHGKGIIRKNLRQFGFMLVWEATELSVEKYFDDSSEYAIDRSFNNMLHKIGGICYNKQKGSVGDGGI